MQSWGPGFWFPRFSCLFHHRVLVFFAELSLDPELFGELVPHIGLTPSENVFLLTVARWVVRFFGVFSAPVFCVLCALCSIWSRTSSFLSSSWNSFWNSFVWRAGPSVMERCDLNCYLFRFTFYGPMGFVCRVLWFSDRVCVFARERPRCKWTRFLLFCFVRIMCFSSCSYCSSVGRCFIVCGRCVLFIDRFLQKKHCMEMHLPCHDSRFVCVQHVCLTWCWCRFFYYLFCCYIAKWIACVCCWFR